MRHDQPLPVPFVRPGAFSRRALVRRLPAGGLAAGLALAPALARAQGATPIASPAAGGLTACGDPKAGQSVAYISPEGTTLGHLAITQVVAPFEGYSPDAPRRAATTSSCWC